jgi:transcription initiation factor TFIIIB Brf1 subunit/transcription initiation factor TFIIB
MTDFEMFNNLTCSFDRDINMKVLCSECQHHDIVLENGISLCTDCGEQIDRPIIYDKDWRFYSAGDSGRSDPNRVHARKIEEKNISKDVVDMNFSDSIVSIANGIYTQCTNGQIYRGGSRKAVIFACVFHAYKLAGNHQTPDNLIRTFGLTRKAGLKGMKIVNVNIPKDSDIHQTTISPNHIINDIMNKFLTTTQQKQEVYDIYKKIDNRSSKLNRARPQSVAAAVIYYWVCQNKINISIKDFATTTNLSELTINKNKKEVEQVMDTLSTTC